MTAGNAANLTICFERLMVGGARVASLNLEQTARLMLDLAQERAGAGHPLYLTSVNGEVLARRYRSPDFAALVDAADLVSADGQALVFASRLLLQKGLPERVATTDQIGRAHV